MEDTFIKRKGVWKRILISIIKMTSGVVYSIVMHSLLITAYALLMFQILSTNEFDDQPVMDGIGKCFMYLISIVGEVSFRWFSGDPVDGTVSGHFAHLCGSLFFTLYMVPLNPIEAILFIFFKASIVCWTFFVYAVDFIPAFVPSFQIDGSLTEPMI